MPLGRLYAILTVPETAPNLARAQLSALKLQVPLLYVILLINSIALAHTHVDIAPPFLTFVPLLLLGTICVVRTLVWMRLKPERLPDDRLVPLLRRTNRLCMLLGPSFLLWALCLAQYGDEISHFHVFFFVAITMIACVFCLMHLRSAALLIAAGVIVPFTVFAMMREEAIVKAIAINQFLVGGVMVFILFVYYRDFVRLTEQNGVLEALGAENFRLAATDALTGLPNRRSFFPALDDAILRTQDKTSSFTLGIIDLDGFKGLNDTYGHMMGDRVLEEVARRLRTAVPADAVLARLGGDEFALILCDAASAADLSSLCQAIFSAVNQPFVFGGTSARVGASIGFARFSIGDTAAQLIERADFALYEAKAHRRGAYVMFAPEHETHMRLQSAVEHALRHADFAAEFSLAFQPMIDVASGRTTAFEALARWCSPHLGQVPPDRFIAVAERTGLINELTRALFAKALATMATWPADVALSFNLSVTDITSPEAVARLSALVEQSGIAPERLQFEVTETAMIGDFAQALAGLERLKALGVSLSLDDFGTGYCSLSYVHALPVDKLKIDQSFTRALLERESAHKIITSILDLSRGLGLQCVVEGVETSGQAAMLQSLGCQLMQGYLFHKPMPAEAIPGYLSAGTAGLPQALGHAA